MTAQTHTLQRGTTERTVLVTASRHNGSPATGLAAATPGLRAGFARSDGSRGAIELVEVESGSWTPGGFGEIDPGLTPGVYRFCVPDEVIAAGATRAVVVLQLPDAVFQPIDFDIVAFDPQDVERIGMDALAFEQRINCLTTAFPLLAVQERERLMAQRAEQA